MTSLTTSPPLARALAERNFDSLTPVQTAVLADDAAGRDLLVSAQTGSGKTVAYGLAIANDLLGERRAVRAGRRAAGADRRADARAGACRSIASWPGSIAMPARASSPASAAWTRAASSASSPPAPISWSARRAGCAIISSAARSTSRQLKAVVLDEADEMLDWAFARIWSSSSRPRRTTRRTLLFSATMPHDIVGAGQALPARRVAHRGRSATKRGHADIDYRAIRIAAGDVDHAVVNILRFFESPSALVFCNTREAVRHLQASCRSAASRSSPCRAS